MDIDTELKTLEINSLTRGRYQPRRAFDPEALNELAVSIKAQGIIEPIVVRPMSLTRYEIVAGERRWRAAQLAGLTAVPCLVRAYTDEQAAEVTLIENIQREDLNPIESAVALQRLLEEFFYTHEELAGIIGKSRTKITNSLRLLNLDVEVQRLLIDKQLSEGHGKILVGLPSHQQLALAKACVQKEWSVRQLEQSIKAQKNQDQGDTAINPNIRRLEKSASDHFGAEVVLENNPNHSGWIKLKYQNYDVLSGILEKMGIEHE